MMCMEGPVWILFAILNDNVQTGTEKWNQWLEMNMRKAVT